MAKSHSRKSRRERRQGSEAQIAVPTPSAKPTVEVEDVSEPAAEFRRKRVDFAQEYFHVYSELRNIFIIAAVMFVVMVGFLYII